MTLVDRGLKKLGHTASKSRIQIFNAKVYAPLFDNSVRAILFLWNSLIEDNDIKVEIVLVKRICSFSN